MIPKGTFMNITTTEGSHIIINYCHIISNYCQILFNFIIMATIAKFSQANNDCVINCLNQGVTFDFEKECCW